MTPPRLIAFCGQAGSGKSTCSEFLEREWGYHLIKFAASIKEMLRVLGLSPAHLEGELKETPTELLAGQTPRYAMQTLGTEWGRELMGRDIWANAWAHAATLILNQGGKVVVDDCRFPNELEAVRHLGGVAINILRPSIRPSWEHKSESHELPAEHTIVNDAGRTHLLDRLCATLKLNCL